MTLLDQKLLSFSLQSAIADTRVDCIEETFPSKGHKTFTLRRGSLYTFFKQTEKKEGHENTIWVIDGLVNCLGRCRTRSRYIVTDSNQPYILELLTGKFTTCVFK